MDEMTMRSSLESETLNFPLGCVFFLPYNLINSAFPRNSTIDRNFLVANHDTSKKSMKIKVMNKNQTEAHEISQEGKKKERLIN